MRPAGSLTNIGPKRKSQKQLNYVQTITLKKNRQKQVIAVGMNCYAPCAHFN